VLAAANMVRTAAAQAAERATFGAPCLRVEERGIREGKVLAQLKGVQGSSHVKR